MPRNRIDAIGTAHLAVLRAIRQGQSSCREVETALKAFVSGDRAMHLLAHMATRGLIRRGRGRWFLTEAGDRAIPAPVLPPMAVYRPPAPLQVRAGSMDYRRVPSVAAGVEREYVCHV